MVNDSDTCYGKIVSSVREKEVDLIGVKVGEKGAEEVLTFETSPPASSFLKEEDEVELSSGASGGMAVKAIHSGGRSFHPHGSEPLERQNR